MRTRRHFSMIELLVTMSVMLLLFALVVPSIRGIIQSSRVDVAASTVAQELRLARSRAVASGRYVAVLIPTAEHNNEGGVTDPEYKASAVRSCYLTGTPSGVSDTDGSWYEGTFDTYVEDSKWRFLPQGAYVGYTPSFGPFHEDAVDVPMRSCNVVSGISFPTVTSPFAVDNMRAIIFRPSGGILPSPRVTPGSGLHTQLWIVQGTIANGDDLLPDPANGIGCEINRFSGKFRFLK